MRGVDALDIAVRTADVAADLALDRQAGKGAGFVEIIDKSGLVGGLFRSDLGFASFFSCRLLGKE